MKPRDPASERISCARTRSRPAERPSATARAANERRRTTSTTSAAAGRSHVVSTSRGSSRSTQESIGNANQSSASGITV
ncbi:hypothetical protein BC477_07035 [Clavibacter michiganensis subsp. michiganensis]|uniref:Uncharacterized protein n=1 Tax=Clavibacter michiganensis subsp. michiganensis TaxID=33013 RepID=A0A251XLZ6_CLAMM|nr:hypothetical protein BC477_07035 [Clavibacter michiganensis subsp. michiganensis]OUE04471.1 hypothetical protein CMMCAS07_05965 [Clavibacter michiganensis subsp. michiganensis]